MRIYRVSKILQHKISEERGILKYKRFVTFIIREFEYYTAFHYSKIRWKQYIIPRSSESLKKFNVTKLMKRGI